MTATAVCMAAAAVLIMAVSLFGFWHYSNQINDLAYRNCVTIEKLKAADRELAQAAIDRDLAFMRENPGVISKFVIEDLAAKRRVVRQFAATPCKND